MRYFIAFFIGFFCILPNVAQAQDLLRPQFSNVMPDLPIMPGLSEDVAAAVIFDKPEGRILETRFQGAVKSDVLLRFYNRALPALGWAQTSPQNFQRDQEHLKYKLETTVDGVQDIIFSITPVSLLK